MLRFSVEAAIFGVLSFGSMVVVDLTFLRFSYASAEGQKVVYFLASASTIMIAIVLYRLMVSVTLQRRIRLRHEQEHRKQAEHQLLSTVSKKMKELLVTIPGDIIPGVPVENSQIDDMASLSIVSSLIEELKQRKSVEPVISDNRDRLRAVLDTVPALTGLFHAHLSETCGTTEAATVAIIGSLAEVRSEVEGLITTMDQTKNRVAELHKDAQARIAETSTLLDGLEDYKRKLDRKIGNAIKTIIGQMHELRSFTDIIHDVTDRTNVVAINASIEATHAGKFGLGFAVVSSEVRNLSTTVESAAADIEERVNLVSDTINRELNAITDLVHGNDEDRWIADIALAIPRLASDFNLSVEEMDSFVMKTREAARLVLGSVVDVLGDAQFQDIIRQQIEQVQKGLALLGEELAKVGKYLAEDQVHLLDTAVLNNIVDTLERSYTMSGQRRTHREFIEGKPAEQGTTLPKIELF